MKIKRLTVGDVCTLTEEVSSSFGKPGDRVIIEEVSMSQGEVEYSTTAGAWLSSKDLELLYPASQKSLELLTESQLLESGEEFDEDGAEDYDTWTERMYSLWEDRLRAL